MNATCVFVLVMVAVLALAARPNGGDVLTVDVPAVTEPRKECIEYWNITIDGNAHCKTYSDVQEWTCADKERILLMAEDGSRHCIKFNGKDKEKP